MLDGCSRNTDHGCVGIACSMAQGFFYCCRSMGHGWMIRVGIWVMVFWSVELILVMVEWLQWEYESWFVRLWQKYGSWFNDYCGGMCHSFVAVAGLLVMIEWLQWGYGLCFWGCGGRMGHGWMTIVGYVSCFLALAGVWVMVEWLWWGMGHVCNCCRSMGWVGVI